MGRIDHCKLVRPHPLATMGPLQGRRPCPGKNRPSKTSKHHPLANMGTLHGRLLCPGKNRPRKTLKSSIHWQPRALSKGGAFAQGRIDHRKPRRIIHWQTGALSTGGSPDGKNRPRKTLQSSIHSQPRALSKGGALALGRIDHGNPDKRHPLATMGLPREVPLPWEESTMETSIRVIHRVSSGPSRTVRRKSSDL